MKNKALVTLCLLFGFYPMKAQIDTEFWFAAPEVSSLHADRPIYLHISSLNQATTITISQPANPAFGNLTRTIPANSSTVFDLTGFIDDLENASANFIVNKGLFIKSTAAITVYYEVYGSAPGWGPINTDIFVLKGRNALGTEFYTPFQTFWDNYTPFDAWSSFDMVATEDNTVITITPTKDLVGHAKGVTFSVTLNKGQTYSCRAVSRLGPNHAAGSHITSNKPIAVTIKDDSLFNNNQADLTGDQIVPVIKVGKEYVVIKGSGTFNDDRIFICATQNNTSVFIDGNSVPDTILAVGQTYTYKVNNSSTFIKTSEPVYVFHITGLNSELGGALLPPTACTGSRDVRFRRNVTGRPSDAVLKLNIIVKAGGQFYFKLNGNSNSIPADSFHVVPGSGGVWMTAQIIASHSLIPEGSVADVSNDSANFHLGVIGRNSLSFEYGYFSDYGGSFDLGPNKFICKGESVVFDAGIKDSYLWNNGSQLQSFTASDSGKYFVATKQGGCLNSDTVYVYFNPDVDCSNYIEFPNLITPNNDSLNEVFFIKGLKPGTWSLEVFNRWGSKVYFNESYDNTWNGKDNVDGVYYFHLRHVKGVVNYKGWVEILRGDGIK
jgi:gliding motility-associated-like protein